MELSSFNELLANQCGIFSILIMTNFIIDCDILQSTFEIGPLDSLDVADSTFLNCANISFVSLTALTLENISIYPMLFLAN